MHFLTVATLFGGAAAQIKYAGNQVPFVKESEQVASNFPDVDDDLYSPAFLDPDHIPEGFANGTAAPNPQQYLEQFLWTLASKNDWMTYHNPTFKSEEGRSIPYVVLSSSKSLLQETPFASSNATNKVRVWLQG
jgi:hypothetical protein